MRREDRSITTARYTLPSWIHRYVDICTPFEVFRLFSSGSSFLLASFASLWHFTALARCPDISDRIILATMYQSIFNVAFICIGIMPIQTLIASPGEDSPDSPDDAIAPIVSDAGIRYDPIDESEDTGWALYIDNDVLVSGGTIDHDYTGGVSFTLSGARSTKYLLSIDGLRQVTTDFFQLDNLYSGKSHFGRHSFSFGFTLFTPANLSISQPIPNDHPYASFLYISNSEQIVVPDNDIVYHTNLSVGFLGLQMAETVQKTLHDWLGAAEPQGWDNQISSGGELTAKYTFGTQKLLYRDQGGPFARHELKLTTEGNLGFITNASVGFNWRWGRLTTPWWSFVPHLSDYINMGVPVAYSTERNTQSEFYFWLGSSYQLRVYNAILQGQFRDSAVTFSDDELERFTAEFSTGIVWEFSGGYRLGLFYRHRSPVLKLPNTREPKWGGLTISKSF